MACLPMQQNGFRRWHESRPAPHARGGAPTAAAWEETGRLRRVTPVQARQHEHEHETDATGERKRQSMAPDVAVILVEPIMGENIGAAARVMKNFGLRDLRLVSPKDPWWARRRRGAGASAPPTLPPTNQPQAQRSGRHVLRQCHRRDPVSTAVRGPRRGPCRQDVRACCDGEVQVQRRA